MHRPGHLSRECCERALGPKTWHGPLEIHIAWPSDSTDARKLLLAPTWALFDGASSIR